MRPRILLINGSPRKYGCVAKLLKIAEKGVIDAGGEPTIIHLIDYNIKPCMGCVSDDQRICRFPCIINDDFNKIGNLVLESDGLIFGTPLYWYNMSGLMKNLIDRMTSMENMIIHVGHSLLDGKVAGFIVVGNDSGSILALAQLMITLNSMGVHIPPWAIAYHHTKEDVLEDEQAVLDAYNVGYNVTVTTRLVSSEKTWYRVKESSELKKIASEYSKSMKALQYPEREKLYSSTDQGA